MLSRISDAQAPFARGILLIATFYFTGICEDLRAQFGNPPPNATNAKFVVDSLLGNGDLEKPNGRGEWPEGWGSYAAGNGITWEVENGKHFLRLVVQSPGQLQMLAPSVKLTPDKAKSVQVTIRYRSARVVMGDQPSSAATVLFAFMDKAGRLLDSDARPLALLPNVPHWTDASEQMTVPQGTTRLLILPGLLHAKAGTLDVAGLSVMPAEPAPAQAASASPVAGPETARAASLLPNGDFQQPDAAGDAPAGWSKLDGMTWEQENGRHFVRLVSQKPGQMLMLPSKIAIPPETRGLQVSVRYRTKGVQHGEHEWFDSRTIVHFLGADGNTLKNEGGGLDLAFSHKADAANWTEVSHSYIVPEGAHDLLLKSGLFQCAAGTVDLGEIRVTPMSDAQADRLALVGEIEAQKNNERVAEQERDMDDKIVAQLAATGNLVPNGNFEADANFAGWPDGWGRKGQIQGISYEVENGKHFMRLTAPDPEKELMLYRMIPLPRGVRNVEVTVRYRTSGVVKGQTPPGDARAVIHFLAGRRFGHLEFGQEFVPQEGEIAFTAVGPAWTEVRQRYAVPEGATKLQFMPGLWNTKPGSVLDLAEMRVEPVTEGDAAKAAN
jgi:hypothetical protein